MLKELQDPEFVATFQRNFGVKEVARHIGNPKDPNFIPIDVKDADPTSTIDEKNGHINGKVKSKVPPEFEGRNLLFYRIESNAWWWVFNCATLLGEEMWYTFLFSFWFWNIDGNVGRKVYHVFANVLYIGSAAKDFLRQPRPQMPPCIQLETKYAMEYGMPSTHAMGSLAVPAAMFGLTYWRYSYPLTATVVCAILAVTLISSSRLYLGVHTVADLVGGFLCGAILVVILVPSGELLDEFLINHITSPFILLTFSTLLVVFYPPVDRWTPAREDSSAIYGGYVGLMLAYWSLSRTGITNYQEQPHLPFEITIPTPEEVGRVILRVIVGASIMAITRVIMKPVGTYISCLMIGADSKRFKKKEELENWEHVALNLAKFLVYIAIGFNMIAVAPFAFKALGIERTAFFHE